MNTALTFIKHNTAWSRQLVCYLACITYVAYHSIHTNWGSNTFYIVARCSGALMKCIFIPSIIPPISKVLFSMLRNSRVGIYLGLDRRISDHKLFGYSILVLSIIHGIAHVMHGAASYNQPLITGGLLVLALILPLYGVFFVRRFTVFKKISYSAQVIQPHRFGALLFMLLYAFHCPDHRLRYFAIGMMVTFIVDRLSNALFFSYATTIKEIKIIKGKEIHLNNTTTTRDSMIIKINQPKGFGCWRPGQYVTLNFPGIDGALEVAHPFTIVNIYNNDITLWVKKCGVWTNKLFGLVDAGQNCSLLPIKINGPFGANLLEYNDYGRFTYIATGIGITPLSAFLNYSFKYKQRIPFMDVHFSSPLFDNFCAFVKVLNRINDDNIGRLRIHFYLTQPGGLDPRELLECLKTDKINAVLEVDAMARAINDEELLIIMHTHRANLEEIVKESEAVGACGNHAVVQQIERFALKHHKKCIVERF